ncbi:MAG TPA: Dyp-type peroxidase [Solirubrobacteraceae bacterium]|nr:Dyp-type peroxidase [Solirubrobacteraceae bacterium]
MGRPTSGVTRRAALTGATLLGVGAATQRFLGGSAASRDEPAQAAAIAFHGPHQAGIATPQQAHLSFAAFDVTTGSRARLRELLREWTAAAHALTAGVAYDRARTAAGDPGEAVGLGPARLTLTFGFGPGLFGTPDASRFGLGAAKPRALAPLRAFAGQRLEPSDSGGDLCVQACADDPQVTFHAIHVLAGLAGTDTSLRWIQQGFRAQPLERGQTSRNLIGFKDGTNNIDTGDAATMSRFVWVRSPAWMRGGTYLVARRIQIVFPGWDGLDLSQQERAIGRYKSSGAPLGARNEHDAPDLTATDARGNEVIPVDAHIRVAGPEHNGGQRMLRRGYSFSSGVTTGSLRHGGHQVDGGLFFIAMARDPRRQVIPILDKVSTRDALSTFTMHTDGAIFACPPGCRPGGYVGEQLLG